MWDKVGTKNWQRPLLLKPDNFTPAQRTPWGGRRIVNELKVSSGIAVDGPVGESWELSVEPDFPSRLADGPSLEEVLRTEPTLLGREAALAASFPVFSRFPWHGLISPRWAALRGLDV